MREQALNPKHYTLNPEPQTLNSRPYSTRIATLEGTLIEIRFRGALKHSINLYFIRVPLKKSIKVWYSKAQLRAGSYRGLHIEWSFRVYYTIITKRNPHK